MKTISIKRISLINFKGLKNESIEFQNNTDIFGANGTGKTTIFDAFTWLLFGKDSTDRKDFGVKTLDEKGKIIPMIEHEVNAIINVNGEDVFIRRILKENWVKKRGFEEREFAGNITDYYWNDVPMQQKEFQSKVSHILDESVFKMITNPIAFNSIKWQERRNTLIDIAGKISDADLASGNPEYEHLLSKLTNGKTLEDYKKQVAASVKKAKDDIKMIPTRVDEVNRNKPESQDFHVLEIELEGFQKQLEKVDSEIADSNKGFNSKLASQRETKLKANELKTTIEIIESGARKEAKERLKPDTTVLDKLIQKRSEKISENTSYGDGVHTLTQKRASIVSQIESIKKQIEEKRNEWETENSKELNFGDADFHCPTCKREFESGDVESKKAEMLENYKTKKSQNLQYITDKGKSLASEKENLEREVETIDERIENGKKTIGLVESEIESLTKQIESEKSKTVSSETQSEEVVYESILALNPTYQELLLELELVEKSIEEIPSVDNSELVSKRNSLIIEIDSIKSKLQTKTQIEAAEQRVQQLLDEERTLAQQIASVEKEEFLIDNFIKHKIDNLERTINQKFKFVTFKMFDEQINGGLSETCEALINGVPFSDANTASKINAGIDIINTLCEFYGVTAPIFIDNRESVVSLLESESQIINLIVSGEDKILRVA